MSGVNATAELSTAEEPQRLAAVRRYDILDTPPDGAFDRVTSLAARLLEVPVAIVSIVDEDRIWFKSHYGLDVEQVDREPGLCASAVLQGEPWLVNDARLDPRTLANSLVAGEFGLRFYLGIPLRTTDGYGLGTLCVIDREPREVDPAQVALLKDLAAVVMDELELRLSARRTVELEAELRRSAQDVAATLQESLLPARLPQVSGLHLAARYHAADRSLVGGDFYDVIPAESGAAIVIGDVCGKGTRAAALTGTARWTLRTVAVDAWTPADGLRRLNQVVVRAQETPDRYATLAIGSLVSRPRGGAVLTVALAGHPHPLIVRRNGRVEAVGVTAPVVGWEANASFTDSTTALESGETLVMFTDGVLDSVCGRSHSDDGELRTLLAGLAGAGVEAFAARLDRALGAEQLTDDAAFVIAQPE